VNRGRTENYFYPSQGLVHQTDDNHQIFDPTKIPRGRSKTNHQLKFLTSTNLQNNRRPQIHTEKLDQQILMDKSPHQLAKTMSTSSEEFRKFVNHLLYEDTSKLNFHQNMKIFFKNSNGRFSIPHQ
jgi:hypothetical protein